MGLDSGFEKFNKKEWKEKGFLVPSYDVEKIRLKGKENPHVIHFGAGNIFRAYTLNLFDKLISLNMEDRGIICVSGKDTINSVYKTHNDYSILVTLKANGTIEKKVLGAIADSVANDDYDTLDAYFKKDSLQFVSFTITEKGYNLFDFSGEYLSDVKHDIENGLNSPLSLMGVVTKLLYTRYKCGFKLALLSMDNFSHNGDKLKDSILKIAVEWNKRGFVEPDFIAYLNNKEMITFPWSMIDKITPRPDEKVKRILEEDGLTDTKLLVSNRNTFMSSFVNAEEKEYLVIEDDFPNGRVKLEDVGAIFTDKETVDKVEKMKVCTCLNPLHTALAIFGCLLGFNKIADEMKDETLNSFVRQLAYKECLPVSVDPKIIRPEDFLREVLEERVPNTFLPDTPQRIATDTSQKFPIRFGVSLEEYIKRGVDLSSLTFIPLVISGWIRYLTAVDDYGELFEISPDPLYVELKPYVDNLYKVTSKDLLRSKLRPILKNKSIFKIDLVESGLEDRILDLLIELNEGKGSVRRTLEKYVEE